MMIKTGTMMDTGTMLGKDLTFIVSLGLLAHCMFRMLVCVNVARTSLCAGSSAEGSAEGSGCDWKAHNGLSK